MYFTNETGSCKTTVQFGQKVHGWTLHMIMCVLLCYPVSIRIYYQQGGRFLVNFFYNAVISEGVAIQSLIS